MEIANQGERRTKREMLKPTCQLDKGRQIALGGAANQMLDVHRLSFALKVPNGRGGLYGIIPKNAALVLGTGATMGHATVITRRSTGCR